MSGTKAHHPDRRALTLAQRTADPFDPDVHLAPSASGDARVRLQLLAADAQHALATRGTDAARARLEQLQTPDLWAGTVQDGVARGFAIALEEAISLCKPADAVAPLAFEPTDAITGRDLRKRREFVVKSGGARVRFSRRGGITLIDRKRDITPVDCVRFEDRRDSGTLDGFEPVAGERPRLFSPAFLQPSVLFESKAGTRLVLSGRLGRRHDGFPCELELEGRVDADAIRMTVRIENRHEDHRLRIRFAHTADTIRHAGTPAWETVHARGVTFVAATLVRACGRLRVDSEIIDVPEAQCLGRVEHEFLLGGDFGVENADAKAWQAAPDPAD